MPSTAQASTMSSLGSSGMTPLVSASPGTTRASCSRVVVVGDNLTIGVGHGAHAVHGVVGKAGAVGHAVHGLHAVARAVVGESGCQGARDDLRQPIGVVIGVAAQAVWKQACPEPVEGLPLLSQLYTTPLTLVKRLAASYSWLVEPLLVANLRRLPTGS